MPKIKNYVCLSADERITLQNLISKGSAPAKSIMHANVLLAADENNMHDERAKLKLLNSFM